MMGRARIGCLLVLMAHGAWSSGGLFAEPSRQLRDQLTGASGTPPTTTSLPEGARLDLVGRGVTDESLEALDRNPHLQELNLTETQVTDAGLQHLGHLRELHRLWLWGPNLTDAGLKHVGKLEALEMLNLTGSRITGAGLRELSSLRHLRTLVLTASKATDEGLRSLELLGGLQALRLGLTHVTDSGLVHVAKLQDLRSLDLDSCPITDAGLQHVARLRHLRELRLSFAPDVTDAGLERLRPLVELEKLDLTSTRITDAGLRHLREFKQLQELRIGRTQVTNAGLKALDCLTRLTRLDTANTMVTRAGLGDLRLALPTLGPSPTRERSVYDGRDAATVVPGEATIVPLSPEGDVRVLFLLAEVTAAGSTPTALELRVDGVEDYETAVGLHRGRDAATRADWVPMGSVRLVPAGSRWYRFAAHRSVTAIRLKLIGPGARLEVKARKSLLDPPPAGALVDGLALCSVAAVKDDLVTLISQREKPVELPASLFLSAVSDFRALVISPDGKLHLSVNRGGAIRVSDYLTPHHRRSRTFSGVHPSPEPGEEWVGGIGSYVAYLAWHPPIPRELEYSASAGVAVVLESDGSLSINGPPASRGHPAEHHAEFNSLDEFESFVGQLAGAAPSGAGPPEPGMDRADDESDPLRALAKRRARSPGSRWRYSVPVTSPVYQTLVKFLRDEALPRFRKIGSAQSRARVGDRCSFSWWERSLDHRHGVRFQITAVGPASVTIRPEHQRFANFRSDLTGPPASSARGPGIELPLDFLPPAPPPRTGMHVALDVLGFRENDR